MSVNDHQAPLPAVGEKDVAAAGTPERLSSTSIRCNAVVVTARPGNTGKIAVGLDDDIDAAAGAEKGIILGAGQAVTMSPCFDVQDVWVDSTVNGEGVSYQSVVL